MERKGRETDIAIPVRARMSWEMIRIDADKLCLCVSKRTKGYMNMTQEAMIACFRMGA